MLVSSGSVVEVDSQSWEKEIVQADCVVLVEFWHPRCPWCRMLEPVYSELAREYVGKVKFTRLNVLANTENQHIAARYGVMSTPTLLFLCHGRAIQGIIGLMPKSELQKLVDDVLNKYKTCLEKSTQLEIS